MTKHLTTILSLLLVLLMVSCHKKDDKPKYRQTVIVYMMAENSLSSYVQSDLSEMTSATTSIPENCNVIVYMDKADNDLPSLMKIEKGQAITIMTFPEQDSCDKDVFANVIKTIAKEYPSEEYSLVMWSHGSGWIPAANSSSAKTSRKKTIGVDNNANTTSNYGSELGIISMNEAIEGTGIHFNFIMFDACFMQCVEVAYELRNDADYIIGSPAEIPGNGAPYDKIMSDFFTEDNYNAAKSIAQDYYDSYKNNYGVLLSVIKTSELEGLAKATSSYLPTPPTLDSIDDIQKYCAWSAVSNWYPEFCDMGSLMNSLVGSQSYSLWSQQLEKAVPIRLYTKSWVSEYDYYFSPQITDGDHYAGVSMFLPMAKYESNGYNTTAKNTQWWKDVWGD